MKELKLCQCPTCEKFRLLKMKAQSKYTPEECRAINDYVSRMMCAMREKRRQNG